MSIYLGVNIDHIATLRQARGVNYPSVLAGALLCEQAGANSITLHLREDRRHIQDDDVILLKDKLSIKMNLEMAATNEMIKIATRIQPKDVCIVPENRQELTTEGGLDVVNQISKITELCKEMQNNNITTSIFIDADIKQINSAKKCGAKVIELNTGAYANNSIELINIEKAAKYAFSIGLKVNAGHGLTISNTMQIAAIKEITELNIGHSIIARAIFVGLTSAIKEIKDIMYLARK